MTPNTDTGPGLTCELHPPALVDVTSEGPTDLGHDELVLLAQLSSTNTRIANYISRVLNLDRGRTQHTKPLVEVEHELAENLLTIAQSLQSRIQRPHRIAHRHCVTTPVEPDSS